MPYTVRAVAAPSTPGIDVKLPVLPPAVVKLWLMLNASPFVFPKFHVATVGANDSAALKSSTGIVPPDAGFTPRRMIMRSTGIADGTMISPFRAAITSSAPGGRFSSEKLPLPFADPNHHPMPTCDVRNPVTPPKEPLAVRVVTFCTSAHCAAARAAISCAVYWYTVVRNPPESSVTSASEAVAETTLNEYDVSFAGISRVHGPLPSRTATKCRGSDAEQYFHLMLPVEGGATTIVIVTVWSPCDDAPRIVAVYVPLGAPPLRISVFTVLPVVGDGVRARK